MSSSPAIDGSRANSAYDALFRTRYHGAGNHRGVLYHALWATHAALDMYAPKGPQSIVCEGIEDVDLHFADDQRTFVQLKNERSPLSISTVGKILGSFMKALRGSPDATFLVVSASGYSGELGIALERDPQLRRPPAKLLEAARKVCPDKASAKRLLARTTFETRSLRELEHLVELAAVERLELDNPTQPAYVHALLLEIAGYAGRRERFTREDIERVRQTVWEVLAQGPQSVAIQSRLVEAVRFGEDAGADDYYDGRSARAGHIAADMDVPRADLQRELAKLLDEAQVCVIVASSGQGKSSLAYRYLRDHVSEHGALLVRGCKDEEQAGSIAEYLETRLRIGVPLTVLIDGVGLATKDWQRLVARLAGRPVKFLLTAREEDWKRFGNSTLASTWRLLRPHLELNQARRIYSQLLENGRVHPKIRSAESAWERVHEDRLLIEFVYLVTQGMLLEERLREQIRALEAEDPAKLDALRLISAADRYGVPLTVPEVLGQVSFRGDPALNLRSLEREYITVTGSECSGLHPVRSRHITDLLDPYGRSSTVDRICSFLRGNALPLFVASALADPDVDTSTPLETLIRRCVHEDASLIEPVWHACYQAAEDLHVRSNAELFDEVREALGGAGLRLMSYLATPDTPEELIGSVLEIYDEERRPAFRGFLARLRPRDIPARADHILARGLLRAAERDAARVEIGAAIALAGLAMSSGLPTEDLRSFVGGIDWQRVALDLPFEELTELAVVLGYVDRDAYLVWLDGARSRLESRFKRETRTLALRHDGETITIRFVVDGSDAVHPPVEQATGRLTALAALLPGFETYATEPIHPLGNEGLLPFEDAVKRIARESLPHPLQTRTHRMWREAIDRTLATDAWSEWEAGHSEAEREALVVLQLIESKLIADLEGRALPPSQFNKAQISLDRWNLVRSAMPDPPLRLDDEGSEDFRKSAGEWAQGIGNVISHGVSVLRGESAPDDPDRYARLLRFIPREICKHLGPFHDAMAEARRRAGLDERRSSANAYKTLLLSISRILTYMEQRQGAGVVADARRAVSVWHSQAERRVLDELERGFEACAEDLAFGITLPQAVLSVAPDADSEDASFPAVVIGVHPSRMTALGEELLCALGIAAIAIPDFAGCVYAVGIHSAGRRPVGVKTFVPTLARIVLGEKEADGMEVLPIPLPRIRAAPFSEIPVWNPAEDAMLVELVEALERAALARASLMEGERLLDRDSQDERDLLALLESEAGRATSDDSALDRALARLRRYEPSTRAGSQWRGALAQIERTVEDVLDVPSRLMEFNAIIDKAWADYLEAAYGRTENPVN